jgi:hypothetical protein
MKGADCCTREAQYLMQIPELHAGRYLTESAYNNFLLTQIALAGPDFDHYFAKEELQEWHKTYCRSRRIERGLELVLQHADKTTCLVVKSQEDLEHLHALAKYCPFLQLPGFIGVLSEITPLVCSPFPVFTWENVPAGIDVLVSLEPELVRPPGYEGQVIVNDFKLFFVDMARLAGLAEIRFRYPEKVLILYADYRNGTNFSTLAGSIGERFAGRFVTIGLLSAGSEYGRRFTHTFVLPFYYLWPLALLFVRPDIMHLNVGAGTQGILFALFVGAPQRTVIDFYDICTFIPDVVLEQGHYATLAAARSADRYLFNRFYYFVHKCSGWVSERLRQKFNKEHVVQLIEFVTEPMQSEIDELQTKQIRLVYGGQMLGDDNEPEDSYFKRNLLEMANLYAQEELNLFLYPSPYLYGYQKNHAIEAMIKRHNLSNVHNCIPLKEDEFILEAAQYDFAAIHVTLPEHRPMATGYIFPAKFLTYLRAGLPIVVPDDLTCVAELVEQHRIGVVFRYDDAASLPALLKTQNIKQLKENVCAFREKLTLDKGVAKVLAMYELILSGEIK